MASAEREFCLGNIEALPCEIRQDGIRIAKPVGQVWTSIAFLVPHANQLLMQEFSLLDQLANGAVSRGEWPDMDFNAGWSIVVRCLIPGKDPLDGKLCPPLGKIKEKLPMRAGAVKKGALLRNNKF